MKNGLKQVRCIDSSDCGGMLKLGQLYSVRRQIGISTYFLEGDQSGIGWAVYRFEEVK